MRYPSPIPLFIVLCIMSSACSDPAPPTSPDPDLPLDVGVLPIDATGWEFVSPAASGLEMKWEIVSGTGLPSQPLQYRLVLINKKSIDWKGNVRISIRAEGDSARFFMPGFLYGTNRGGATVNPDLMKHFPRLRKGPVSPPFSPCWYMRSDQLTHPVAMMYAGGRMYGIAGSPFDRDAREVTYHGFYCSLEPEAAVGYTAGHLDAPGRYVSPFDYLPFEESEKQIISISSGDSLHIPVTVYTFKAEGEYALGKILKDVYRDYHEQPSPRVDAEAAMGKISSAISRDAFDAGQKTYALISKQAIEGRSDKADGGGLRYRLNNLPGDSYDRYLEGLISWTNGTVIAVPLLEMAHRTGQPELRDQALKVIDHIVRESHQSPTGLPYCTKLDNRWTNRGWWTSWIESEGIEPAHSSYILGQAVYYILNAYETEKAVGVDQKEWLDFAESTLSIMAATQNDEGAFPRFWDEDAGRGSQYEAFSGCWVAAAMALHGRITGKGLYAEAASAAEKRYRKDVERMECFYTPLDVADAPDSEGILAYIRLTRVLYEMTGDDRYLEGMLMGLDYSFSYKFCYQVPHTEAPLDRTDWHSSGGDITSVCNAVIHCMSNSILEEIAYAFGKTEDPYYLDRLRDTHYWGLQSFNTRPNEFFFGKEGWSTEYFCQSNRYVLDIRLEDGSRSNIWFAYHPWATASILEGLNSQRSAREVS
jgi:hypothetical protein